MSPLRSSGSISAKLTRMNFMVSAMALVLACVSFFAYDLYSFRQALARSLETEAQIIGANSITAILFNDEKTADETLSALRNSPNVLAAEVVSNDGDLVAVYHRANSAQPLIGRRLQANEEGMRWVERGALIVGRRILLHGESVGTVYIKAETGEVLRHAWNYGLISIVILFLCLLSALLFTFRIRRFLAAPLIGLAQTAQVVTNRRDYSIRAMQTGEVEEVSVLVNSFNEMLGQIEQRDKALEEAKGALEQRVQERTAELSAANQELEAFSYSVAHDLRGPLDTIGNIGFVLEQSTRTSTDEAAHGLTLELLRGTGKMTSLISDLLNLSRAGRVSLHTVPVDLSQHVRKIVEELQAADPERQVNFTIQSGAKVMGDANLLCIVMENLLRNAWKYTSRTATAQIEFGSFQVGKVVGYFVRDNGAGFDMRFAERLFKPFQRLHTDGEFPGTGIGLATVQRIIARHGGTIWAEARVNGGATFFFTIDAPRPGEVAATKPS